MQPLLRSKEGESLRLWSWAKPCRPLLLVVVEGGGDLSVCGSWAKPRRIFAAASHLSSKRGTRRGRGEAQASMGIVSRERC
jgi:hypothetical protein